MMVDRRWDDRSRAAKGDCAGKRSNVRRLDRAESELAKENCCSYGCLEQINDKSEWMLGDEAR